MATVLTSTLVDKPVLSTNGYKLGRLHQLTVDIHTGRLATLIVDPEEHSADYPVNDQGRYTVEIDRVQAVHDYILID